MSGDGGGVSGEPHDGPHPSHRASDQHDQGPLQVPCHDGADTMGLTSDTGGWPRETDTVTGLDLYGQS